MVSAPPVRLLLIDDHAVVREGLRALLHSREGFTVVGEAWDGERGVTAAVKLSPDVVLLDISMPGMDGIEAARRLRRLKPAPRLIMVSINDDSEHVLDSFKAGAAGYIVKDSAPEDLFPALECVLAGDLYCSEGIRLALASELKPESLAPADRRLLDKLAPRPD